MEKTTQVIELERLLSLKLKVTQLVDDIKTSTKTKTVLLDENLRIIGLNLAGSQVRSIKALYVLTDLVYLNLTNNQISDLSPLKDLINFVAY